MIKLKYPELWQKKSLLSYSLTPLSLIYFLLSKLRALLATPISLPALSICVGNATIGGTGKTQVVIWLAKQLAVKGMKCVILCKGYGGSFKAPLIVNKSMSANLVGDEALELCLYATTIIATKVTDAMAILTKSSPDVILVDDGMQNPNFTKDLIIMVIDGQRGFGNQMLFPAGPMRQSVQKALKLADALIVTHYEGEPNKVITGRDKTYKAIISTEFAPSISEKYYAFAGIGNPERFFYLCKSKGANVIGTKIFPDHHKYSKYEIEELLQEAAKHNAKLITTRKDYVKLRSYKSILSLNVSLAIENGEGIIDLILALRQNEKTF